MNRRLNHPIAACAIALAAGSALGLARPAAADITVVGHYQFVDGDTVTRSSAWTPKRTRMSGPDGREFIYDAKPKKLTIIDHKTRTYWSGPLAVADSISSAILMERRKELKPQIEANQERWAALIQTINDSIKVEKTEEYREIAGYSCNKWVLRIGPYLTFERWVTPALGVADYAPELERVVLASVLDPLGRVLLKSMLQMRSKADGLALASTTRFETLTQKGEFSFEATRVQSTKVPDSVWQTPAGYRRVNP